ncbi:MAG: hypothetical protein LBQ51_11265 [Desulfovibrio sp.]|jgi:hypothetical protein|nr:hypothetical protein [Desulfovibrio sp.]
MKILGVLLIMLLPALSAGGCSWAGRTAGKAQAKIERGAQDLEQGYQRGYEEEKGKSRPAEQSSAE